jgi:hypothetical protein
MAEPEVVDRRGPRAWRAAPAPAGTNRRVWLLGSPSGRGRSPVSCQRAAGDAPEEVVDELQENLEDEQYESPAAVMADLGD